MNTRLAYEALPGADLAAYGSWFFLSVSLMINIPEDLTKLRNSIPSTPRDSYIVTL